MKGATLAILHGAGTATVSIHAPREGRDSAGERAKPCSAAFQSTRPVKGATPCGRATPSRMTGFNPRAP